MGDGEAEACLIRVGGVQGAARHVVQSGGVQAGDQQRVALVLGQGLHCGDLPQIHLQLAGDFAALALDCLTQGQGNAGGGLGDIFAEHQHGVGLFHVAQAGGAHTTVLQDLQHFLQAFPFALLDAAVEVGGAHQFAQGEVALKRRPGRADADDATGGAQGVGGPVQGPVHRDGQLVTAILQQGLARAVGQIDVAVAEAAAVAQEVVVQGAVIAVLDAAQLAVTLTRADVAADRAPLADAGGELHVPLAVVAFGVGLVGEHTGGADLHQVAGEFALQSAILDPAEVDVVMGAVDPEILATGVILVVAHAAIAGDAAVHLVVDEGAQILILVGALGETVAAAVVAGHHRHVLQVAGATLFAHRAVVGVVGHLPLHHRLAELFRLFILDGDIGAIGGGGHAGHDQAAALVVGILILLHRTLAAGADATERRVPAKIGDVQPKGETGLQQVICPVYLELFTVYMNGGHTTSLTSMR